MVNEIQATGIIAEYNPFHNGHLYQLEQAKKLGLPIVVAMSGHTMQRGELACLDKWTRAQIAVDHGVSLVVELPDAFTLRSAQYFAEGGVQLLRALGCVHNLCCGTEHPELPYRQMAELLVSQKAQRKIHDLVVTGVSYAQAVESSLEAYLGVEQLRGANDILALEYTKAVLKYCPDMSIHYLQRQGSVYNDNKLTSTLASATAIRVALAKGENISPYVPAKTAVALLERYVRDVDRRLWLLLKYLLTVAPVKDIYVGLRDEELANLFLKHRRAETWEGFIQSCMTKRYPASRIRRSILRLLLPEVRDIEAIAAVRVLAFDDVGRAILRRSKKSCPVPIITKLGRDISGTAGEQGAEPCNSQIAAQLQASIAATNLYALVHELPDNLDYTISPYYKKFAEGDV